MPSFSQKSLRKLDDAHPIWQSILNEAIEHVDFTIIETFRNEERQNAMFQKGQSQLRWPDSKHNVRPSMAVDIAPYPIDWDDLSRFYRLVGFIEGLAWTRGVEIRAGIDWDRDWEHMDNRFNDAVHIELYGV